MKLWKLGQFSSPSDQYNHFAAEKVGTAMLTSRLIQINDDDDDDNDDDE